MPFPYPEKRDFSRIDLSVMDKITELHEGFGDQREHGINAGHPALSRPGSEVGNDFRDDAVQLVFDLIRFFAHVDRRLDRLNEVGNANFGCISFLRRSQDRIEHGGILLLPYSRVFSESCVPALFFYCCRPAKRLRKITDVRTHGDEMPKTRKFKYLALAAVACTFISCGGDSGGNQSEKNAELQALMQERWTEFAAARPGARGSSGIEIHKGGARYFAAAGDPYEGGVEAHIRGASTTKTFTAAATMLLHQRKKLDIEARLTDPIPGTSEPYLPDTPEYAIPYKEGISIEQLLNHRAGVFDVVNTAVPADLDVPYAGAHYIDYVKEVLGDITHTFTFDELASVVASSNLSHSVPGGPFHYSDTGYMLLAKIIERVSGLRYHEFLQREFLDPLALRNTSFPWEGTDLDLPEPIVPGFTYFDGQFFPAGPENFSGNVAEGNIRTTPDDLSKWIRALLRGKAGLNHDTITRMKAVEPTGEAHQHYGLGLVYTDGLGYGHNGGHAGYITVMRYDPDTDITTVMFMSLIDFSSPTAIYAQQDFMYDAAREAVGIVTR